MELDIRRPKAWSMHTVILHGGDVVATLSGSKGFGRKAVATIGGEIYIMTSGGRRRLFSRMRRGGADDVAVMEHTGPTRGTISYGDSTYELSRSPNGRWDLISPSRTVVTIIRDPKDPTQGRAMTDTMDEDALTLILMAWFAMRTMDV